MQTANPYEHYKSQSLQTLTKGELVVKLFEEASKQVSMAIFLANTNAVQSFNCIVKARNIVSTLKDSLDMNHAISIELNDMYLFLIDNLNDANSKKDTDLMKQLLSLINDLKATFKQADRIARAEGHR